MMPRLLIIETKYQHVQAEKFNKFFISKIAKIREELDTSADVGISNDSISPETDHDKSIANLEVLLPASEYKNHKIIPASPPKSCDTDPIPTWLLKKHLSLLVPVITRTVNLSLESATFPIMFQNRSR